MAPYSCLEHGWLATSGIRVGQTTAEVRSRREHLHSYTRPAAAERFLMNPGTVQHAVAFAGGPCTTITRLCTNSCQAFSRASCSMSMAAQAGCCLVAAHAWFHHYMHYWKPTATTCARPCRHTYPPCCALAHTPAPRPSNPTQVHHLVPGWLPVIHLHRHPCRRLPCIPTPLCQGGALRNRAHGHRGRRHHLCRWPG